MNRVRSVGPRERIAVLRAALLLLAICTLAAGRLNAQRTVVVYEEPHHRVVVDEGDVKLLDIQILPGDTTLYHTHDAPILYTFINLGNGSANGRVTSNLQYADEPFTHQVSNGGSELFRIIALTNYGPGVDDLTAGRPDGFGGQPQVEDRWFRSYRIELAPGEETGTLQHRNDAAIVQVTDGKVDVTQAEGFGANFDAMGDWTWREAESPYRIQNVGQAPVTVVVNEARRPR